MSELVDRDARASIRADLDDTLLVEAAAGTGKTTELVNRIIAVLQHGRAAVDSLVAVTFTEKAAGELKLRLRAGLERARHDAPAGSAPRRRLEAALARLEEARVSTIHGFCADLLRERPVEARVDPQFRVLTEPEAERLYGTVFDRWLQEQLQNPPEGVRRALRRPSRGGQDGPSERLRRAGWMLAAWRDFPAPWRRDPFAREAEIDGLVDRVHAFAALTARAANPGRDVLYRDTAPARRLSEAVRRAEAVGARDHDEIEAALVGLAGERDFRRARKGSGTFYAKEIARAAVYTALQELVAELDPFRAAADADLAAALHAELRGATDGYERAKERAGALDFVDLLVRARDLVRDDAAVRADFQRRFTHLFVDEFQDTDPLQAEILLLLAADEPSVCDWRAVTPVPGKLFIVGDPKQSIYRFRRADVGVYLDVKAQLAARGARVVQLTTSFRGAPSIQQFVNAAFAPVMQEDASALQAAYVPLSPHRAETAGQPTVVALPVPHPYGVRDVTKGAIERSLPDAVGAFLEWLLHESGWTVTERDRPSERVPVAPRHVCLLFRRFDSAFAGDVTRPYVRALEARAIPHLLVGGKSFHAREEVETMRAALSAIEWPDDELSVFATLRGSLFAIGDEELFLYRHARGRLHPFRLPEDAVPERLQPILDALGLLAALHRARNRRPVAETIALLLEATRAHAGFALRPSGEQVLANVLHVAELARTYEATGGTSFRGFVERLLDEADRGQTAEAPILEEGSEGVRIMTAHRAKGLEFPVVLLADLTAGLTGGASRHVDAANERCALRLAGWVPAELREHEAEENRRDEAEGVRVAYVAATRARDLLVVPAVGDAPFASGWVSCLNGALYPAADRWRAGAPAPGCPRFGDDTVLERPAERAFDTEGVKPGRYDCGAYAVTWWDPQTLALGAPPLMGIRQEQLLGKDAPPDLVRAQLERHEQWRAGREAAVESGSRPSVAVCTATARAAEAVEEAADVEIVAVARERERPAGPRFGALVHAVLATVALDAGAEQIEEAAALNGRLLGATAEEVAAAARAAAGALRHPLMRRARAAWRRGGCRRETPVALHDADGTLVEGVVDLAFLEDGAWTVVDFKTDQEVARSVDTYRRQAALYARAIAAATGQPATAVLLRV